MERAKAPWLIERDRLVYCPYCQYEVEECYMESHLASNRHLRHVQHCRYGQQVREATKNGQLPEWMDVRDDNLFCTLCKAYATDDHLASRKHQWRLQHPDQFSTPPQQDQQSAGIFKGAEAPQPHRLPEAWGNPDFYEWKAEHQWYWCKLCYRVADDNHLSSARHVHRTACPEEYLDYRVVDTPGAPPLPPPPPRAG